MMNHINSYTRKYLEGCSPIQIFKAFFPSFETLFQQLQMHKIPAHNICALSLRINTSLYFLYQQIIFLKKTKRNFESLAFSDCYIL